MIYVKMVNLKRGLSSKGFNPQRISRDLQWVVNHGAYYKLLYLFEEYWNINFAMALKTFAAFVALYKCCNYWIISRKAILVFLR